MGDRLVWYIAYIKASRLKRVSNYPVEDMKLDPSQKYQVHLETTFSL